MRVEVWHVVTVNKIRLDINSVVRRALAAGCTKIDSQIGTATTTRHIMRVNSFPLSYHRHAEI